MKRSIQAKLYFFIDEKLKSNGLAQHAIEAKDARTLFRLSMQSLIGVREIGGNNQGEMVELIQSTIGGAGKEPWCMAAVQSCIAYAEEKTKLVSPIIASEHCLTVWNDSPKEQRVKSFPLGGAIVIWRHGTTSNGHTGCLESTDGIIMHTYEGNTESGLDESGKIEREGGGFYYCKRGFRGDGSMKVVGFLKPF